MELNLKHVFIYNAVMIPLLIIGYIFKQVILIDIGFLGMFAQSLPIVLAMLDRMFREDPEPVYDNKGRVVNVKQNDEVVN